MNNETTTKIIKSEVPDSKSFARNNYEIEIYDWNKKNNNNLTKWVDNGQMIEIEKWLFVNVDILMEHKAVLKDFDRLIRLPVINLANMHGEVKDLCQQYANSIEGLLDRFFSHSKDIQITLPFSILCPIIIKQPHYLVEASWKYPNDLPEHKKTYYKYEYLKNKIGFGEDKFNEYKQNLNRNIRIETSNKNNALINSMFLFVEQFIDDLNGLHRTHFSYFVSPLFRLLFDEVIKTKGYYFAAFGHFNFTNILETEKLLKSVDEFAETDSQLNIVETDLLKDEPSPHRTSNKKPLDTQDFTTYIKHKKPDKFAKALKEEFSSESGKGIALFVYCLKDTGKLKHGTVKRAALHKSIKKYFGTKIGTAKTLNDHLDHDYNNNGTLTSEEISEVSKRIVNISNSLL